MRLFMSQRWQGGEEAAGLVDAAVSLGFGEESDGERSRRTFGWPQRPPLYVELERAASLVPSWDDCNSLAMRRFMLQRWSSLWQKRPLPSRSGRNHWQAEHTSGGDSSASAPSGARSAHLGATLGWGSSWMWELLGVPSGKTSCSSKSRSSPQVVLDLLVLLGRQLRVAAVETLSLELQLSLTLPFLLLLQVSSVLRI